MKHAFKLKMRQKLASMLVFCLLLVSIPFSVIAEPVQETDNYDILEAYDNYDILEAYFAFESWAFYGRDGSVETDLSHLVALQAWNRVLNHENGGDSWLKTVYNANLNGASEPENGILKGPVDIADKLTVVRDTEQEYEEFVNEEGEVYKAQRYKATLTLSDSVKAEFTILRLQDKQDVIVDSDREPEKGKSSEAYVVNLNGAFDDTVSIGMSFVDGPLIYGNGAMLNDLYVPDGTSAIALHITSEHMGGNAEDQDPEGWWKTLDTQLNKKLCVYERGLRGVEIKRKAGSTAAAWGFASCPVYATGNEEPIDADIFLGNTSITITAPTVATGSIAIKRIEKISPMTDGDHRIPLGPGYNDWTDEEYETEFYNRVASISESSGVYTVSFKSAYYTDVPLQIEYVLDDSTETPVTETGFLQLRRVGLDLKFSTVNGQGESEIFHGTDSSTKYKGGERSYVSAVYYYPNSYNKENEEYNSDKQVQVLAKLVWADKTEFVTVDALDPWYYDKDGVETMGTGFNYTAHQGTTALNDFILWEGEPEDAPDEVYAFAIEKSDSEDTFGGVKIGSDQGVWLAIFHDEPEVQE